MRVSIAARNARPGGRLLSGNPPESRVFGPVPSRRLGLSLGVDIIPYKVCSLDCVYCQVGRTTDKTAAHSILHPIDGIVDEIRAKLESGPRPDYITIAGSGEPTLHTQLGKLIDNIHLICDIPVAIITNGTLLTQREVRYACAKADLIVPSLDAGSEAIFQQINRPADDLNLADVVEGMVTFRAEFAGQMWLEIFLIKDINDADAEIDLMVAHAARIRPDRIQLNTAVRPTADVGISAMNEARMTTIRDRFGSIAEVIADYSKLNKTAKGAIAASDLLDMIRRRPVTAADIASGLGVHPAEILKHLGHLIQDGAILEERRDNHIYYRAAQD
jgi:wyosine [tRNA(Phe)-imidazoG37] synthetase (radical SAM superfamily)